MYTKTQWVDNTTPIDKDNLNKIEQGIYDNSLVVDAVTNTLNPTDTETYKTAELTEGQITDVIGVSDILIKGQTSQNGEPTPSSPVDVNVVSGSNIVNTSSKNLFEPKMITTTKNGITCINNWDGTFTLNGTATADADFRLDQNTSIGQDNFKNYNGTYTLSCNELINGMELVIMQNQTWQIPLRMKNNNTPVTATFNKDNCFIYIWVASGKTLNNLTIRPQLEKNSTATTYEPHQGKELPLDLDTIELCKIGNYQDYFYKSGSKWYLHKGVGKYTLDGTNNAIIAKSGTTNNNLFISSVISDILMPANNDTSINLYCSHFIGGKTANYLYLNNALGIAVRATKDLLIGVTLENTNNTVELINTWLSTNNVITYYPLATATDTEITGTLKEQLEAIYNAPLYEETNITQENNDLPMVLDITACKDNINGIKAFIRK